MTLYGFEWGRHSPRRLRKERASTKHGPSSSHSLATSRSRARLQIQSSHQCANHNLLGPPPTETEWGRFQGSHVVANGPFPRVRHTPIGVWESRQPLEIVGSESRR